MSPESRALPGVQCNPSADEVEIMTHFPAVGSVAEKVGEFAIRKPTYPRLQPNTLIPTDDPLPLSGTGVCGNTGPAAIHRIPVHRPAGAGPTLEGAVGVGFAVGPTVG
jgi:hypothetical protein